MKKLIIDFLRYFITKISILSSIFFSYFLTHFSKNRQMQQQANIEPHA